MNTRDRVLRAARALAAERRGQPVSVADVARLAKVSWPTARRHLGSDDALQALVARSTPFDPKDTRARLLTAAARVIARAGYERTSLDDVALEAGLTKGAVYWHFDTKHALLVALAQAQAGADTLDPALYVQLLAVGEDPQVREALQVTRRNAAARFAAAHPAAARLPAQVVSALSDGVLLARFLDPGDGTEALLDAILPRT